MGLFRRSSPPPPAPSVDEIAARVAELVKAELPAPLPPAAAQQYIGMFGPGVPMAPRGIDPRDPVSGGTPPRRSEFPVAVNLNLSGQRLVPFDTLRDVADRVDVIRRCVEVRKAQMHAFDFDVVLTRQATRRIMRDDNIGSPGEAAQAAREKFEPEMIRLREWWEKPDRYNGMDFQAWLDVLLEEQLVLDAVSIWPRRKLGGDIGALELIDGATIKPLLDHRGSTPVPPAPAYQQILHGFARGDFTATDGDGYRADQIVYRPRRRRTFTPFGFPEVEHALSVADIYLKRMAWIRGEFTDGRMPDSWIKLPAEVSMTPDQMREWELVINEELADPTQRRSLRMLPPGGEAEQMSTFADLYKPDLDEALIKLLCMCFGVLPTEIGFPPSSGIGGKGHQEGEANSAHRKTTRPYARWLESLLTDLSRDYLGMPPELEFKLLGYEVEDQAEAEGVADSQMRRGAITLNDDRAARGMPLYTFPEADTPFIVTGSGLVFLDGAMAAQAAAQAPVPGAVPEIGSIVPNAEPASATDPRPADDIPADGDPAYGEVPEEGEPIGPDDPVPDGFIRVNGYLRRQIARPAPLAEAAKFVRFAEKRSGRAWRPFEFTTIDGDLADRLNDAGAAGDIATVKSLVADLVVGLDD